MRPTDALVQAMAFGCMQHGTRGSWAKPGAVIERMRGEPREALKRLTSDDLAGMRVEPWELCDETWTREQEIRKLLSDFDRKLRLT